MNDKPPSPFRPRPSDMSGVIIGVGLSLLVLSVLIFLATYNVAHECSSGLVYALDQSQCQAFSLWHSLSIGGGVLSVITTIGGIVKRW